MVSIFDSYIYWFSIIAERMHPADEGDISMKKCVSDLFFSSNDCNSAESYARKSDEIDKNSYALKLEREHSTEVTQLKNLVKTSEGQKQAIEQLKNDLEKERRQREKESEKARLFSAFFTILNCVISVAALISSILLPLLV